MIARLPIWEPPAEALDYSEFAKTLLVPDGPYKGEPFDPTIEAPQKILCDVFDGKIRAPNGAAYLNIVVCWPVQSGKSLCTILVPSLHTIVQRHESCVYCLPTHDLIGKIWTDKLKPAIEGAGFAEWISSKGPGSRGGRPSSLPLVDPLTQQRAGSLIFIAGGSGKKREVGQSSVTAAVILLDEADEYEDQHRLALVEDRAAAYGDDALTITASTVKKDDGSIILAKIADSNDGRVWYACPKCGRFQLLSWDQVSYDNTDDIAAEESARYKCKHCETLLDVAGWKQMLTTYRLVCHGQEVDKKGKVIGDMPRSKTFGLLCHNLDFGLGLSMSGMAVKHRKAQLAIDQARDHGLMRSFYRDLLSQQYTHDRDELPEIITNKYLAQKSKRAIWAKRSVPSWAEHLFMGVDVQHDRLYWCVIACTSGMRWAPVDWGYEYGDCGQKETATEDLRRGQLNIVRDKSLAGWTISGTDEIMVPIYNCVDVGYATDEVTAWINQQAKGTWVAVRGYGEGEDEPARKAGKKETDLQGWGELRYLDERREKWLFCESQTVIRWLHDSLMRESGHEGSGEIPRDSSGEALRANDVLLLHITQNVWDYDIDKAKWFWRKVHAGRRDFRDCIKYALILAKFIINQAERRKPKPAKKRGIRKVGNINARRPRKPPGR